MLDPLEKILGRTQVIFVDCQKNRFPMSSTSQPHRVVSNILLFLEKGKLSITYPPHKENMIIQAGDLFFLPKAYPISIKGLSDPYNWERKEHPLHKPFFPLQQAHFHYSEEELKNIKYVYVSFEAKVLGIMDLFRLLETPPIRIEHKALLLEILMTISQEIRHGGLGNQQIIKMQTQRLVIHLLRYLIEKKNYRKKQQLRCSNLLHPKLEKLLRYIGSHLGDDLSNQILAQQFYFSPKYVGQFFKSAMQINLQEYIKVLRLQAAAEIFAKQKGDVSIQQISRKVGYESFSYFCRNFKNYWGITSSDMCRTFRIMAKEKEKKSYFIR